MQTNIVENLLTVAIAYNTDHCLEIQKKVYRKNGRKWQKKKRKRKKVLLSKNYIIYAAKNYTTANAIYNCGLQREN